MYDLGASTGNITKTLGDVIKEREVDAISIDNSSQMASVWAGIGRLELADVANYNFKPFDFACCFLTLMFLSQEDQQAVLGRLRANMRPGGAIFVLDKVAPYSGYLGIAMHRLALAQKVASGVPSQAIVDKELSLSGVQRPIDPKLLGLENEVFRFGEFAGWVLV
jgi:tRNA (cmo5U34)-methyltransferase